ncbi:MAG: hypothetical protein K2X82_06900, partial [Gemmataceae bacterium]|nr:hypothetical protein [Gemmataceae bacterium]
RAAAAAARAAAGDDPSLTLGWDEWGILQDQAFAWLSADLAEIRRWAESAHPNTRRLAADTLTNGQKEDAFASVRDPARRAGMPAPDRERWERFWAEVEAVRARAGPPTAPPPREAVGATR